MPEAVRIFIAPPSEEALRTRLIGRGTDDPGAGRGAAARRRARSSQAQGEFPHVVINDRLEDAVAALEEVVRGRARTRDRRAGCAGAPASLRPRPKDAS